MAVETCLPTPITEGLTGTDARAMYYPLLANRPLPSHLETPVGRQPCAFIRPWDISEALEYPRVGYRRFLRCGYLAQLAGRSKELQSDVVWIAEGQA
jgi:hypothetical protein